MTFDRVLPELIRLCEEDTASRAAVARSCVVRDVRGRVRLVVEPTGAAGPALARLETTLQASLGAYFVSPIIVGASGGDLHRLAKQLLEQATGQWPTGWPRSFKNVLGGGDTPIDAGGRWTGIERTIGKDAWLTATPPGPPWPLVKDKTPPIVTFHSFKGGVGRTTLVAAYAMRLSARVRPPRIAVIDLDLEAPGVGSLFDVSTERGVLDMLVDHIATGRIDLGAASSPAQLTSGFGQNITVFPAGRVNDSYVQKLARLDFTSSEPGGDNPVGVALAAMLLAIKPDFDVILLDARAGLHDIAGMSLHGLAHVDVLVFRGTTQNLTGLGQTLRTLGARAATQLVLVETLLPANDDLLFEARRQRTRERVYELLCEHVYPEDDPPQLPDVGAPHDVVSVRRREWLDALDSMKDHATEILNEADLAVLARRIDDQCKLDAEGPALDIDDDEETE